MPLAKTELEILQVRKLIQCVRDQDNPSITKMIELGIPNLVNYQGKLVPSCVQYSTTVQLLHIVVIIICGLVAMVTDPSTGCTPLHVAVIVNLEKMVTLLLENGASSSIQDNEVYIDDNDLLDLVNIVDYRVVLL